VAGQCGGGRDGTVCGASATLAGTLWRGDFIAHAVATFSGDYIIAAEGGCYRGGIIALLRRHGL
jgi:hypothetical protein